MRILYIYRFLAPSVCINSYSSGMRRSLLGPLCRGTNINIVVPLHRIGMTATSEMHGNAPHALEIGLHLGTSWHHRAAMGQNRLNQLVNCKIAGLHGCSWLVHFSNILGTLFGTRFDPSACSVQGTPRRLCRSISTCCPKTRRDWRVLVRLLLRLNRLWMLWIVIWLGSHLFSLVPEIHLINGNSRILKWRYCTI
jgi:hypothetical protein